jgi:DNA-binding protein Fis
VWLIAATHRDLKAWSEDGKFRLGPDARELYAAIHGELDRQLLPRVLEFTGGNQHLAALLLGIARQTLRAKLRDLGLHVAHSLEASEDETS